MEALFSSLECDAAEALSILKERIIIDDDNTDIEKRIFELANDKKMRFDIKLYEVLQLDPYPHIFSWDESGTSFVIYDRELFKERVLKNIFKMASTEKMQKNNEIYDSYALFVRQVTKYGFTNIKELRRLSKCDKYMKIRFTKDSYEPKKKIVSVCLNYQHNGSFEMKLHEIIQTQSDYEIISWSDDGKSFIIQNVSKFVKNCLPILIDLKKHMKLSHTMKSFEKLLTAYHFIRVSRNVYQREGFVKDVLPVVTL